MYSQEKRQQTNTYNDRSRAVAHTLKQPKANDDSSSLLTQSPQVAVQQKLTSMVNNGTRAEKMKKSVCQLQSFEKHSDQTYNYGAGSINVGKDVQAWLDPDSMPTGQSANLNTSQDDMMSAIRHRWGITGGDLVKGHLLNDNMGGSAMNYNLYPITRGANKDHLSYVENAVKQRIWGDRLGMYYRINVSGTPNVTEAKASFNCEIKEWDPQTDQVGGNVISPVTIPSDLNDVRGTGEAYATMDGSDVDRVSRPKKPSWATAPKKRVSDLTSDEYDDRMDQGY